MSNNQINIYKPDKKLLLPATQADFKKSFSSKSKTSFTLSSPALVKSHKKSFIKIQENKEQAAPLSKQEEAQIREFGVDFLQRAQYFKEKITEFKTVRNLVLDDEIKYKSLVEQKAKDTNAASSWLNQSVRAKVFEDVKKTNSPDSPLYQIANLRQEQEEADKSVRVRDNGAIGILFGGMAFYLASKKFIAPRIVTKLAPQLAKSGVVKSALIKVMPSAANLTTGFLGSSIGTLAGTLLGSKTSFSNTSYKYGELDQPHIDAYNQHFFDKIKDTWLEMGEDFIQHGKDEVFPESANPTPVPKQQESDPSEDFPSHNIGVPNLKA